MIIMNNYYLYPETENGAQRYRYNKCTGVCIPQLDSG